MHLAGGLVGFGARCTFIGHVGGGSVFLMLFGGAPFLTVASQQAYQFGYLGMQMLIERIKEKNQPGEWKKIVLPTELLLRRSVRNIDV